MTTRKSHIHLDPTMLNTIVEGKMLRKTPSHFDPDMLNPIVNDRGLGKMDYALFIATGFVVILVALSFIRA